MNVPKITDAQRNVCNRIKTGTLNYYNTKGESDGVS